MEKAYLKGKNNVKVWPLFNVAVRPEEARSLRRLEGRTRKFNTMWRRIMFWVYILKCADNSYYTGHTDNLENRLEEHHNKFYPACYTAIRLPVQLMFSQIFATREEALASERQIKGWRRKKKDALINENWKALSIYAKRQKTLMWPFTLRDGAKNAASSGRTATLNKGRTQM